MAGSRLWVLALFSLVCIASCNDLVFQYRSWEHCYYEPISDIISVDTAEVQVVQSINHMLGFQFYLTTKLKEPLLNASVSLKLWHAETGNVYRFGGRQDICKFVKRDDSTDCYPLSGVLDGMIERLFVEELSGTFEAELRIFDEAISEEILCVMIPFKVQESFLTKFQEQRAAKWEGLKANNIPLL